MRLREPEMPLDPEVERELDAIDGALAGEPVDPDLANLAQLAILLRSERPEPTPEVEAELDRLAAAGFPPRSSDRVGRLRRRASDASRPVRAQGSRRLLPALGVAGVFVVAIGIGASQSGVLGGGDNRPSPAPSEQSPATTGAAKAPDESGAPLPINPSRASQVPLANRKVAQTVDLALSTSPGAFRDAADGVLDVVDDHRGYVIRSTVSGGDPGFSGAERGRASFALRIPAGELSAAMGDLSDLGHVVSRSDGTVDITKRFVSARKRIDALTASRDRLLQQLGEAVTITEQQSIRARLRIVEAQLAGAHDDLAKAHQRVHLVPVSVTIAADAAAETGSAWTIGDAFHDAGRVLTVTAGAALVGGAALLPFALLAAAVAGARREWVRRQRNRALDAAPSAG